MKYIWHHQLLRPLNKSASQKEILKRVNTLYAVHHYLGILKSTIATGHVVKRDYIHRDISTRKNIELSKEHLAEIADAVHEVMKEIAKSHENEENVSIKKLVEIELVRDNISRAGVIAAKRLNERNANKLLDLRERA